MSLNMYLGEVHTQTQSMNAVCTATIQGMEQAIQSIDAFAIDMVLQGQTYSSAKSFFVQTFRPLAQGIIYLCEELIRQNDAFPSQFQSQVASTDVIEQELLEQIREIDRMKTSMEAISQAMPIPGMDAMVNLFTVMRKKLQEKLDHLYEFNYTSSSNYDTALQLAASIAQGLAEVQSGKGFSPASGTFSIQELNMEWTGPIQAITESKAREAQIEKAIALREQEANRPWYEKTAIGTWEFMKEFFQGAGSAAFESVIGLESPDNDELESKLTYQAGRFTGNVIAGAASIIEILEGLTVIGGSNFLTLVATVGTGGLASPIAITFDAAATTAGVGLVGHGLFAGRNAIQNGKDTLQKFQSSPSSGGGKGTGEGKKGNMEDFNPKTATNKQKGNYGEIKSSDNLLNNQSLKDAGFDLKPVGKGAPSSIDDKIVKGIDGLYENTNAESKIKYVIDEAKFGSSKLGKTKDGPQMSNDWLKGSETGKSRILKAVDGDKKLAIKISNALQDGKVERVLSKVDSSGNVKTYRIDAKGDIIGEWP
ncbi:T7SS effector LXG polymorphic toxin [Bacillus cereus group sp. BfR-BA-01310]|uniref:T7SS effector LXG polymorphic toxin n=1 Tax=Bacillus cereus group sp. BfR-BA-01310 TaxID=2920287 RepID=UPI001F5A9D5C|nr:T7SS effector LXG polymorphic toxin [Bacillus cereus group sp. BfR-BA-01310]